MNFLDLLNAVARMAKPDWRAFIPFADMRTPLAEANLDSLDALMTYMYLCELYGIDREASRDLAPATPQALWDFIDAHKTKEPQSVDSAMQQIR
jgi:hypothetical protein